MADHRTDTRGIALLEALVALAVMSIAGLALLEAVGATQRDRARPEAEERALVAAERVMTAMVLLTRQDLDRRLGGHLVGEYLVNVARPEPPLYRISVAAGSALSVELLTTVVYRGVPVP